MFNDKEQWKKLNYKGIDKSYAISESGRIYDLKSQRLVKTIVSPANGHVYVNLRTINPEYRSVRMVSRLVMATFNPNEFKNIDSEKLSVGHRDDDKTNNHHSNLKTSIPIIRPGSHHFKAILNERKVHDICALFADGYSCTDVIDKLHLHGKVELSTIKSIRNGNSWTHITKNYEFNKKTC